MSTETLEMPSKTRKVEKHEIGSMLRQITMDRGIPGHEYDKLATAIEQEFNVACTAQDVQSYERLHILGEDYELETRRAGYDMQSGFREMFGV